MTSRSPELTRRKVDQLMELCAEAVWLHKSLETDADQAGRQRISEIEELQAWLLRLRNDLPA